jgi:phenylpyruvate tautomerase PptA (4-oxalocrotonate tautomerase family)
MPYLKIQTNVALEEVHRARLLHQASKAVAEALAKPEDYVMVAVQSGVAMLFAGTHAPAAYLELKSIGLPAARTAELSQLLCALLQRELGISGKRVYIEFADARADMWGWDGGTF